MFDVAPGSHRRHLGERLPARVARRLTRFRHGPGAFKVDFAVEGGVPWTNADARKAGTVHLGGTTRNWQPPNATSMPGGCPTARSSSSASNISLIRSDRGRQHTPAVDLRACPTWLYG